MSRAIALNQEDIGCLSLSTLARIEGERPPEFLGLLAKITQRTPTVELTEPGEIDLARECLKSALIRVANDGDLGMARQLMNTLAKFGVD